MLNHVFLVLVEGTWCNSKKLEEVLVSQRHMFESRVLVLVEGTWCNSKKLEKVLVLQRHNVESRIFGACRRYLV
jgi:DTW domain-containing protein YfiP